MQKPFFSRYNQVGTDPAGYQVGAPSADKTGKAQGWKFLQAVPGAAEQVPEWNELQEMLQDQMRDIGDYLLKDGQTIGLQLRVDQSAKLAFIEWQDPSKAGKVYAFGQFHVVPTASVAIAGTGTETIAVTIAKRVITPENEPSLNDPVIGEDNYGLPGSYRWVYDVVPVVKTATNAAQLAGSYDLWMLQDGQIRTSVNRQSTDVDRNLITYTDDISGDCLVRGMRIRVENADEDTLRVLVDRGRAYVGGRSVGYDTTTAKLITKSKFDSQFQSDQRVQTATTVLDINTGAFDLAARYVLPNSPIHSIESVNAPVIIRKKGTLGQYPFSSTGQANEFTISTKLGDGYGSVIDVLAVYDVTVGAYVTDFTWDGAKLTVAGVGSHEVFVTWTFSALLTEGTDFQVSDDRLAIELLNDYPAALNNGTFTVGTDKASYVYPGLALKQLSAGASAGADQITLKSVYGITKDQALTLKNSGGLTEVVKVSEILPGNVLQLKATLTNSYAVNDLAYASADYIGNNGLEIDSPSDSQISVHYRWMLDRVDVVYIDADNNIVVQSGQSNKPAYPPSLPLGVLPLGRLNLPANGDAADVVVSTYDVQRLTQQDIQKLLRRIERAEYNASIQNLKIAAYNKSTASGLALRGILTDAFVNSDVIDVIASLPAPAHQNVAIDPDQGTLSPVLDSFTARIGVNETASTCFIGTQALAMEHTLSGSNQVVNTIVTDVEAIRGMANPPKPVLTVTTGHFTGLADRAATFNFFNEQSRQTDRVPKALEGGYWRTRQARVPWLENRGSYLPAITLDLTARRLPANTTFQVAIDGTLVPGANPVSDAQGNIATYSVTPPAFSVSGHNSRTVRLLQADSTGKYTVEVASTIYGATPSETSFLPIVGGSLAANPFVPMAQTFAFTRDTFVRGVNVYFAEVGAQPVEVQLRSTDELGRPGSQILARVVLNPNQISTVSHTVVTFSDPVFCPAGTHFALGFVSSEDLYEVKKAVVGNKDSAGAVVASRPLSQGALYTSLDGASWTVQTDSALTFQMLECVFSTDSTRNTLVFNPVRASDLGLSNLKLMIARVQQLVPRGTSIDWTYTVNDEKTPAALQADEKGELDPQVINGVNVASVTLQARFRGTTGLSGVVSNLNARLLVFQPKPSGIYTSRAAKNVSTFNSAKVTLELTSRSSATSARVKFTAVDDPYGVAEFTLSGTPGETDKLTVTLDGITYTYTNADASPTLAELATAAIAYFEEQAPGYAFEQRLDGSDIIVSIRRRNGDAFLSGEVDAQKIGAFGVSAVRFNYVELPIPSGYTPVPIDDQFNEYAFELKGSIVDPNFAGTNTSVFRVQVKVTAEATDPTVYPRIRNLSLVVSNN